MDTQEQPSAPTGIVMIASFWVVMGTLLLTITSMYLSDGSTSNLIGLMPFMIGIGIILLGWGLLMLKELAYIISLIFSIIGSVYSVFYSLLFILILHGYTPHFGLSLLFLLAPLGFIAMALYLKKKGAQYFKKETTVFSRICPDCKRFIPFDANYCPYCHKKF
jgi:hypothetical protein